MSSEIHTQRYHNSSQLFTKDGLVYLGLSLLLQFFLGLLFGHQYDMRINMATGYLVASGKDPYIAQNLSLVFHNSAFQGMTSIGYPPPWPLILGIIYIVFFATTHNLLVYNLAIKLPIILANVLLAYLVRSILIEHGVEIRYARKAWLFLLFNPFILYFTTAWGQFDSLVALFTVLSLMLLNRKQIMASGMMLAFAIALKPTPFPLLLVGVMFLWGSPWRRLARYLGTVIFCLAILCILPFLIFKWDATPILHGWNAQFSVSGGMSLTTLYELLRGTYNLPGMWWLLGFAWLPAILIGAVLIPRGDRGMVQLIKNSLVLSLIFFLTRTWLSEQNIALIVPLVLFLVYIGELPNLALTLVWLLPLGFTIFNTSPAQLLFPILPGLMDNLLQWADLYRSVRLVARMILVIPWQIVGWWIVLRRPGKMATATV